MADAAIADAGPAGGPLPIPLADAQQLTCREFWTESEWCESCQRDYKGPTRLCTSRHVLLRSQPRKTRKGVLGCCT